MAESRNRLSPLWHLFSGAGRSHPVLHSNRHWRQLGDPRLLADIGLGECQSRPQPPGERWISFGDGRGGILDRDELLRRNGDGPFGRRSGLAVPIGRWLAHVDRVLLATALLFAGLALAAPSQLFASLLFTLGAWWSVAPFFLLSVGLAAAISASSADRQLARMLRGSPGRVISVAAVFGALSPFCSVSVIPVIAALLAARVPLAPVMAFWIASPLMDPESFVLTAAIIDLPFALVRTAAAMALGLAAGLATHLLARSDVFLNPLRGELAPGRLRTVWNACPTPSPDSAPAVVWRFWRAPERRAVFVNQLWTIGWFLFRWLTLAFALESLIAAWVSTEQAARLLGGEAWWAIPAGVLVGIPTYLNGYAAIPLVAGLPDKGMAPGAALAFMIAGEVTSIPTAMAVWVLVRRGVFAWYLLLGVLGALLAGLGYQLGLALPG